MRRLLIAFLLSAAACTPVSLPSTTTLPPLTTTTTTTLPAGPGLCGTPLISDDLKPDVATATELLTRFFEDRRTGEGAEGCLTDEAAAKFATSTFPLCLYQCEDVATLILPDRIDPTKSGDSSLGPILTVVVSYDIDGRFARQMREEYEIRTVRGPDDARFVLIGDVNTYPESSVTDLGARRVVEDLMAALADGAWTAAGELLVNEGVGAAVEGRIPDIWDRPIEETLAEFCRKALCDAPYEILSTSVVNDFRRDVEVRFEAVDGPVEATIPVGIFEGTMTALDLPPDGTAAGAAPRLAQVLFPDEGPARLAISRYRSIEIDGTWYPWFDLPDARVVGDLIVYQGSTGVWVAAVDDDPRDGHRRIAADPWRLAGVDAANGPVALLTDGQRLVAYHLADDTIVALVDLGTREEFVGCGSAASERVLLSVVIGDSTVYEVYDNGSLTGRFEPDRGAGCGILSPDGTRFVASIDTTLHNPRTVVLYDAADGTEVDRWTIVSDDVLGRYAFDGRYIVAEVWVPPQYSAYRETEDLGRRFVVDTETGSQWEVTSTAHISFPDR